MIEVSSALEGELLIRSILYARKTSTASRDATTLRIKGAGAHEPSLPQITAKAGFRSIEIIDGGIDLGGLATKSFRWHGIDGTLIDTRIRRADVIGEDSTTDAFKQSGEATQVWYNELPIRKPTVDISNAQNRSLIATELRDAEFLNIVRPYTVPVYPQTELEVAWTALLADCSAGSGHDTTQALLEAKSFTDKSLSNSISDLDHTIDTRGLKRPVLVINNHSFFANEAVFIPLAHGEIPVTAIGPEGDAEPIQILQNPNGDGTNYALFVAKNVPLHGYAVWDLGATVIPEKSDEELTVSPTHLENSSIRVEFDAATGLILKIFDKDGERDLLNETFEVQRSGKRDLLLDNLWKTCLKLASQEMLRT